MPRAVDDAAEQTYHARPQPAIHSLSALQVLQQGLDRASREIPATTPAAMAGWRQPGCRAGSGYQAQDLRDAMPRDHAWSLEACRWSASAASALHPVADRY